MSKNQKGLAPIIIILIIIILLVGGILAWQYLGVPKEKVRAPEEITKDETADWKIYRNEKYGFEIKYPPDSFITSETEREDGAFVIHFCPSDYLMSWKGEGSCNCGGLAILPNVKRLSVEEFLEDLYDFYDLKFEEIETKQGIIALEPAWEQRPEYYEKFGLLGSGLEYHYWFVGNPKWIVTVSHTQDCGIKDWGTTPEQLLSTFRFLE